LIYSNLLFEAGKPHADPFDLLCCGSLRARARRHQRRVLEMANSIQIVHSCFAKNSEGVRKGAQIYTTA